MSAPAVSVVVTTYESPEVLDVVLRALSDQSEPPLEVIVADDGSGPRTAAVVEHWRDVLGFAVKYVWQADDGWRKSRILNLGALQADGEYLLFLDGDSLPRRGMLAATRRGAIRGWFLASKRVHLSPSFTRRVLAGDVRPWSWPVGLWLVRAPRELLTTDREVAGLDLLLALRDRRRPWRPEQPDFVPMSKAYGFYFGVWREDFERVNGFDMRFVNWGGEDRDIAARLGMSGVRCGWPGPRASMLHLWHPPMIGVKPSNAPLVDKTVAEGRIEAIQGLRELAADIRSDRVG